MRMSGPSSLGAGAGMKPMKCMGLRDGQTCAVWLVGPVSPLHLGLDSGADCDAEIIFTT